MRAKTALLPAIVAVLLAGGCSAGSRPRSVGGLPPPVSPGADPFFVGLEDLSAELPALVARTPPRGSPPSVGRSEVLEARVARRISASGARVPQILLVFASTVRLAAKPAAVADLLLDVPAEKAALGAEEAVARDAHVAGRDEVRVASMGLLRKGEGPFKYDFRWTWRGTRHDRADGSVLVRYDLLGEPAPERVGAFEGVALVEPDGDGSRWTEVLVLGARIALPFFLKGKARDGVASFLSTRASRMAERLR
jgi:hypothetical protein